MSEIVGDAWKKYMLQLENNPLATKAITAGVLTGVSDALAQKISGAKKLQLRRISLLMLFGFGYGGPFGHFFHKLLDKIFKGKRGGDIVAKQVALEQLISPLQNILFMVYYGLVIEGGSWTTLKSKIRNDLPFIQLASWQFWPIVSWVNYKYMPLNLRVLFPSFVGVCWGIFLNLKAKSGASAIKKA